MITINNSTTDLAGTDACLASGCIDHNNPDFTTTSELIFSDLTIEQQTIYASFFALGQGNGWVNINNYHCVIGIDHITSEVVISDTLDLDYETMSIEDKAIVNAFRDLMEEKIIE